MSAPAPGHRALTSPDLLQPLRFEGHGWSELMCLEPGSVVALHRHTGDVHAYNLSGTRRS